MAAVRGRRRVGAFDRRRAAVATGRRRPAVGGAVDAAAARSPRSECRPEDRAPGDGATRPTPGRHPTNCSVISAPPARSRSSTSAASTAARWPNWSRCAPVTHRPRISSAQLCRQTDGNPFFLAALLAHLEDVAFVRSPAGVWVTAPELDAAGVPHGVRGVISRRLALLGPEGRRALDAAAVAGLVFDERVISGVLDSDLDDTVDALDAAIAAGSDPRGRHRPVRLRSRPRPPHGARRPVAHPARPPALAHRRTARAPPSVTTRRDRRPLRVGPADRRRRDGRQDLARRR